MMKRLRNPYADQPGYNCFGCSPANSIGLQMAFFEDGEEVVSTWRPGTQFQGFHDILHGGIQSTLMDEIASWVVFVKLKTVGVTYRLNTRFKAPVRISSGEITLRARFVEQRRNIATIKVELLDGEGKKCSESVVDYFLIPQEKAEKEFHYPGKEAFY
ncbi:MAG: PaaI family thioesterase [Bacteroidota bacterium]